MMTRTDLHSMLENETDAHGAKFYNRFMTAAIVASLIPLCFKEENALFAVIEIICVAFFIFDYLMRWICADKKLSHGKLSFLIYPFTPMAIIDLVSILPVFVSINASFKAVRILRLARAMRAFKLLRYSKSFNCIVNVITNNKSELLTVLALACAYVVVSALVIFNVEPQTFDTFFDAIYWAVVSLTTVGYGDVYATSEIGKAISMISSLMGIAVVALPSGIITAGLLDELRK